MTGLRLLLLAFATLAGGCAASAADPAYPSLAKRAVEGRLTTVAPEVVDLPAPPPAADLAARMAQLDRAFAQGQDAFAAQLEPARRAVAAAGSAPPSSEGWIAAQMAVSALDAARAPSVAALADLDQLRIARQDAGDLAGETELEAMVAAMTDALTAQDTAIAALAARLSPA